MKIHYTIGNATQPTRTDSHRIICHICNDEGGWGSGFVLALNQEFKVTSALDYSKTRKEQVVFNSPEADYREWAKSKAKGNFVLGKIQLVYVKEGISVCNMIAQRSTNGLYEDGVKLPLPNVNYSSLLECFNRLKVHLTSEDKYGKLVNTLHMPRIGAGLGGGRWDKVEKVIQEAFKDTDIEIFVYDRFGQPFVERN